MLEHIRDRKRVLDTDALVMIFGETFVTEQGLQEDPAIQILPAAVEEEIIVAVKPDVTSSKYSSDRVEIVCADQEFVVPIEAMPEASVNKKVTSGSIRNSSIVKSPLINFQNYDTADQHRGVHSYISRAVFFLRSGTHIASNYG